MISKEEIANLAELARLELGQEEIESLQKDISNILDYVGQLNSFQGDTLESPSVEVSPLTPHNIVRADTPRDIGDPLAGKEAGLRAAFPAEEKGYNVVRKIIQKDE